MIAIWALRVSLGLAFLTIGAAKLTSSLQTVQLFAAIGWGQWFRYLTGLLDVIGALLLFVPRWTCYGGLLLACSVGSATVLYLALLHHNPAAPLALTLLAATLAWLTRPRRVS
ncbi:MAG: DoxX family protein [Bryobacteraceae bacterium]